MHDAVTSSVPLDHTPRLFPQTIYRDEVGVYLSSSYCAVSSAPVFRLLRYGGFLEDIVAEVEVNPDDHKHVITRRFRSRDYHVTFPRVFPIGLWGVRYSLFIIKS